MFEQSTAFPIFPTIIWLHQLAAARAASLNGELLRALEDLMGPRPALKPGQTWQSEQTLHLYPEFAGLVAAIRTATNGVLQALEVEQREFVITGCWANFNPPGSPHPPHSHPNNFLSGVYYVQVPAQVDMISFHDPRPQRHILEPAVLAQNQFNLDTHNIKVQPGTLAIFPGWLLHSVVPNRTGDVRLSIAFNIMLSDFENRVSRPKWQGVKLRRPPP